MSKYAECRQSHLEAEPEGGRGEVDREEEEDKEFLLDITQPTWLSTGGLLLYFVFCFRGSYIKKTTFLSVSKDQIFTHSPCYEYPAC